MGLRGGWGGVKGNRAASERCGSQAVHAMPGARARPAFRSLIFWVRSNPLNPPSPPPPPTVPRLVGKSPPACTMRAARCCQSAAPARGCRARRGRPVVGLPGCNGKGRTRPRNSPRAGSHAAAAVPPLHPLPHLHPRMRNPLRAPRATQPRAAPCQAYVAYTCTAGMRRHRAHCRASCMCKDPHPHTHTPTHPPVRQDPDACHALAFINPPCSCRQDPPDLTPLPAPIHPHSYPFIPIHPRSPPFIPHHSPIPSTKPCHQLGVTGQKSPSTLPGPPTIGITPSFPVWVAVWMPMPGCRHHVLAPLAGRVARLLGAACPRGWGPFQPPQGTPSCAAGWRAPSVRATARRLEAVPHVYQHCTQAYTPSANLRGARCRFTAPWM